MGEAIRRLEALAELVGEPYSRSVVRTMDGYEVKFGFLQPKDGTEAGEWQMVVVKLTDEQARLHDAILGALLGQAVAALDTLPGAFVEPLRRLEVAQWLT